MMPFSRKVHPGRQ
ncbi:unnamed protein product [Acanthoscelides obtectus]|uniref:Uncharacterized protein n=1 Tax=Acanthoscelides obtectus TaxID=200917 RepID=A0A9P0P3F4_ACAOB|nr:unnamed protein product [Acanthoscelides obtectus]CAK1639415.1 hypothetical protein AOBTE_LOCUS11171 [Acanthoscelides obtectus]